MVPASTVEPYAQVLWSPAPSLDPSLRAVHTDCSNYISPTVTIAQSFDGCSIPHPENPLPVCPGLRGSSGLFYFRFSDGTVMRCTWSDQTVALPAWAEAVAPSLQYTGIYSTAILVGHKFHCRTTTHSVHTVRTLRWPPPYTARTALQPQPSPPHTHTL